MLVWQSILFHRQGASKRGKVVRPNVELAFIWVWARNPFKVAILYKNNILVDYCNKYIVLKTGVFRLLSKFIFYIKRLITSRGGCVFCKKLYLIYIFC